MPNEYTYKSSTGPSTSDYQIKGSPDADTPQKHVFAIEGLGGFPQLNPDRDGELNPPADPWDPSQWRQGTALSGSQVVNFWKKAALEAGDDVVWHYYAQRHVSEIVRDIEKIAKEEFVDENGETIYHTIVILGYSNGGHAAVQVAKKLEAGGLLNRQPGVKIDLVITVDPIRKVFQGFLLDRVDPLKRLEFTKGPNVSSWRNYFQNIDTGSVSVPVWDPIQRKFTRLSVVSLHGNVVQNADLNRVLGLQDFAPRWGHFGADNIKNLAHILIPSLTPVTSDITNQIKELPSSRSDWRFQNR